MRGIPSRVKTYRTRNPRNSPLWQCAQRHHSTLVVTYPEDYEPDLGPLRPVASVVFGKFLDCGTLERVRLPTEHN